MRRPLNHSEVFPLWGAVIVLFTELNLIQRSRVCPENDISVYMGISVNIEVLM